MNDLKEIAKLFQQAFDELTRKKCRATARATFNRAQAMLDVLEKGADEVAKVAREKRRKIRGVLGYRKELLTDTMEAYARFWSEHL